MKKSKAYKPAAPKVASPAADKKNIAHLVDQKPLQSATLDTSQAKQFRPQSVDATHRFGKRSGST
jgi:hypothetical protein